MRSKIKLKVLSDILKFMIFHKKTPIAVRWQLTYRCPMRCMYCDIWKQKEPELPTNKILLLLNEMKECGVKKISFSGGEPMLRDDIHHVIDYCLSRGISPEMNSTGFLIPRNIKYLKNLHLLKLSLDGPEEAHDFVRGREGAYRLIIQAAEAAASNKINFIFTATLTKFSINKIEFLLNLTRKFNTSIAFQPLLNIYSGCGTGNFESLYPTQKDYKDAVTKLIYWKRRGTYRMRNSLRSLRHIYNWPK